jgi:small GTP-binding protein
MVEEQPEVRVVFIGDVEVGKTSLYEAASSVKPQAKAYVPTVAGACRPMHLQTSNGQSVKLSLWDTAGSERYRSVVPMYFHRAAYVLVVYDITRRATFESVTGWIELALGHCQPSTKFFLIGNKSDLEDARIVSAASAGDLAAEHELFGFLETSAKTGVNLKEVFEHIAEDVGQFRGEPSPGAPVPAELPTKSADCC